MVNVKKKGNLWENRLTNWLTEHGFKAYRDSASGGTSKEKGDISNNEGYTIESKAAKNISLMEWWRQVDKSASLQGNAPLLFIHQDGMPDNEWLVVMHNNDFIELWQGNKGEVEVSTKLDWNERRAIESLKTNANQVLKIIDRL